MTDRLEALRLYSPHAWSAICAAEAIVDTDPRSACWHARRAAESIARHALSVLANVPVDSRDDLQMMLRQLYGHNHLPQELYNKLTRLRRVGNQAAHGELTPSSNQARMSISVLAEFSEWFDVKISSLIRHPSTVESHLKSEATDRSKGTLPTWIVDALHVQGVRLVLLSAQVPSVESFVEDPVYYGQDCEMPDFGQRRPYNTDSTSLFDIYILEEPSGHICVLSHYRRQNVLAPCMALVSVYLRVTEARLRGMTIPPLDASLRKPGVIAAVPEWDFDDMNGHCYNLRPSCARRGASLPRTSLSLGEVRSLVLGALTLSRECPPAIEECKWQRAASLHKSGHEIRGRVSEAFSDGWIVDIGIDGLIPVGELQRYFRECAESYRGASDKYEIPCLDSEEWCGELVVVVVTRCERESDTLLLRLVDID